jgi:1-acyl-sn-glycerol-3-phosphate acyltransferase
LGRNKLPIAVAIGPPIPATGTLEQLDATLRESMTALLHKTQVDYPHPEGAYWVPRRLGGTAPTMADAKVLDEVELAERARKRAEREARSHR